MSRPSVGFRALLALLVVAGVLLSVFTASATEPTSRAASGGVGRVVVFGIPGLGIGDVTGGAMPNLARLADQGATAAANVRTLGGDPNASEAYASLGAGTRLDIGGTAARAYGASDRLGSGTAAEATARASGVRRPAAVVVPAMRRLIDAVPGDLDANPGAFAEALRVAHRSVAVVSNADVRLPDAAVTHSAPAALAAADPAGYVSVGTVSARLLVGGHAGGAVDDVAFSDAVTGALGRADVVIADPGETLRAGAMGSSGASRGAALRRTDQALAAVAKRLPADTLLMVVGVTPPTSRWALTPVVLHGAGVTHGHLVSPSTHHGALVTLSDVAPTALAALGVDVPDTMIGHALRYQPGSSGWGSASQLDDILRARGPVDNPITVIFIVVQALLYLGAIALLLADLTKRPIVLGVELAAVACAAWPLATFWLRIWPHAYALGYATFAIAGAVAVVVALGAVGLQRHPLDPLLAVCGLTIATLVLDLATGAHLQLASFFGYAPNTSPRFTGIGNAAFAILAGSTIVVCIALIDRARDPQRAWWVAAAIAIVVTVADAAPWMGADVGGTLTLVPVLGLTLWALAGRTIRWRTLAIAAAAAVAALAIDVAVEAFRSPDSRTHIGRFFLNGAHGKGSGATLSRKWANNMHVLSVSPWAWLVPILAAVTLYLLIVAEGWRRFLPPGSPRRIGVLAAIAMGVVGWLLNDSGVVVTALVFVYLGPYLLLLIFRRPATIAARGTVRDGAS